MTDNHFVFDLYAIRPVICWYRGIELLDANYFMIFSTIDGLGKIYIITL